MTVDVPRTLLRKGVNVHAGEVVHPALRALRDAAAGRPGGEGGTS